MPYMFMKLLNYYYLMADSDFDNAVFHGPFLREDILSLNGLDPSREELKKQLPSVLALSQLSWKLLLFKSLSLLQRSQQSLNGLNCKQ